MKDNLPEYTLRPSTHTDEPFIYSAWAKAVQETTPTHYIPIQIYTPHQNSHIARCLRQFQTLILHHPDDPNEYFGFINYAFYNEMLMVHWLYVKSEWQKHGIATSLIHQLYPNHQDQPIITTQFSQLFPILQSKFNLIFDPYFLETH